MIVREIVHDPDGVLAAFDFWNDYQDTRNWLSWPAGVHEELISRLDEANSEYWNQRTRQEQGDDHP